MKEVLYEDKKLMRDIVDIKRFIDDGVGMHCMSDRRFTIWTKTISDKVEEHKMKIKPTDWTVPSKEHGPVNFLDILFSFDERKALQTDLFQKPTDSRSYLNFNSCHPNYTFSGNVTSQALRLRRIINNDERLAERLDELEQDFTKCGYPQKMLKNILDKVKKSERSLKTKEKCEDDDDDAVMVISTFGRDRNLVETTKKIEKHSENLKFKYVKKTGPSFRNTLVQSKKSSLGKPHGRTMPCNITPCKACKMVTKRDFVEDINGKKYKTAQGKCNSSNVIYHAQCKHCIKAYVGKTTQYLNGRISGHRGKFYECMRNDDDIELENDDHLLGLHLFHKHNLDYKDAFNDSYVFTILESCNPRDLDLKEHKWIQKLKCVAPYGLNSHDPFGLPLVL